MSSYRTGLHLVSKRRDMTGLVLLYVRVTQERVCRKAGRGECLEVKRNYKSLALTKISAKRMEKEILDLRDIAKSNVFNIIYE